MTKRPGPVAEILIRMLWRMRLKRSGFRDLEHADNPDAPLRIEEVARPTGTKGRPTHTPADRAEYHRMLSVRAWDIPAGMDREIALMLADGATFRKIMRSLRVGQFRVERVLCVLDEGRKEPWHWREGRPREQSRSRVRMRAWTWRLVRHGRAPR